MKRMEWAGVSLLLCSFPLQAQSSLEILKQTVQQARQDHREGTAKFMANFLTQLEAASASPDAALDLYRKAGGKMPEATPVQTQYEHETTEEKSDRLARDQASSTNLGAVAQIHCGLMRFGGLFIENPNAKGLQDDWIAWLKNAAQIYVQVKAPAPSSGSDDETRPGHRPPPGGGDTTFLSFQNTALHDSAITQYLGFHAWADRAEGNWSVRDLPELYRKNVLEPLREHPTAETLAAWDVYIAIQSIGQPDSDKWNQIDYPTLAFDRACDDYLITPGMEKLQVVVGIIHDHADHPKFEDMAARADKMIEDYGKRHTRAAVTRITTPALETPTSAITTSTQGDMTVVTTHSQLPSTNVPSVQNP